MRKTVCVAALSAVWLAAIGLSATEQATPAAAAPSPTYTKDVAPILFRNCTGCHRPGEIGPMSLLTYEDVRPHAAAIRDEVGDGTMPPWHADAPHGTFLNERGLTTAEKDTLRAWVAGGSPKGDPKDMPAAPHYVDGWTIGKPDVVLEMQEAYKVPADGMIEDQYFYIPTNFTEAKWVQAIEVRPGDRSVVHHVLVNHMARPDMERAPTLKFNKVWQNLPDRTPGSHPPTRQEDVPSRLIATYAPGTAPQVFRPGTAVRLEPGGVLELQMHYTANGKPSTDRTRVGLIFSKDPAPREIRPSNFYNTTFTLPAGSADTAVDAEVEFVQDATVWGLFPHTHLRGKKWQYVLLLPDGSRRTILSVPRYDFNWQTYYMFAEPLQVPKGSKIISTAWYDNSRANRHNPDPKIDVKWGDQTWEEMQYSGILFSPAAAPTPLPSRQPR